MHLLRLKKLQNTHNSLCLKIKGYEKQHTDTIIYHVYISTLFCLFASRNTNNRNSTVQIQINRRILKSDLKLFFLKTFNKQSKIKIVYDRLNFATELKSTATLTGLFLLTPLTHLKRVWINSGTIKILFTISEHSYRESEVGVKFCMINFSKLVYCEVFL